MGTILIVLLDGLTQDTGDDSEFFHRSQVSSFKEDASRIRKDHAPRNMSVLRRLALNLLRQEPSKGSLTTKRYRAGLDDQFMLQILSANILPADAHS